MRKLLIGLATVILTITNVHASTGGIQLSASRIVFNEGMKAVNYGVTNEYAIPALASATVTDFDGKPTSDFAVSPSLFQIQPQTTSQGQVVQLKPLVGDKEIVYWLNVKTILSDKQTDNEKTSGGALQFAIGQRIKLFYRPKSVTENCRAAAETLKWEKTATGLKAVNTSKVSVSLVDVKAGKETKRIADTLLPLSEKEWKVNLETYNNATFKYVDEYGNIIELPLLVK